MTNAKYSFAEKQTKNTGGIYMADIQSLLGEDYREGMTVEEINAVLANRQFVDPTTLPKSVEKTIFDKTASELAKV